MARKRVLTDEERIQHRKETARKYRKAYREAHKDDPIYKEKEKARYARQYEKRKKDPLYKEKNKANCKAYRERHKDDPDFMAKQRAASKAYREAHKDDPDFIAKRKANNKKYYKPRTGERKIKHNECSKKYYWAHREEILEKNRLKKLKKAEQ